MNNIRYYIDDTMVEHGCCWDTAIVCKCKSGKGMYGSDVKLVCECDKEDAEMICAALNSQS